MGLSQTTAPTAEPVTIDEARLWLKIDVDQNEDNSLIQSLVKAARGYCELYLGRQLMSASWTWTLPSFYGCGAAGELFFPRGPVQSVTSINYMDVAGASTLLASSGYQLDLAEPVARVKPAYGTDWPATREGIYNAVTIVFVTGYATSTAVPDEIKLAMRMLVANAYQNREGVVMGKMSTPLEFAVRACLDIHSFPVAA